MQIMKRKTSETYYFSKQLKHQMSGMEKYPLTVVEAPSGFGKTTAVREYLKKHSGISVCSHWYTCMGESPTKVWDGICSLFGEIDEAVEAKLKRLELPTLDSLADLVLLLRKLRCEQETFLVIDNYQLFGSEIKSQIINAFSVHGDDKLHIVFITQPLGNKPQDTVHYANVYEIDNRYLVFDRDSIGSYFRMSGLALSDSELDYVHRSTEGWAAAVRLQMLNYQQGGSFEHTNDIDQLIKIAVWNKLSEEEKLFLLSVSVLESFTTKQALIMMEETALPDSILNLLENNSFIRYFPKTDLYYMHSILQDYLRNRFYNQQTQKFKSRILHRAGEACTAMEQYYPAARFYYEVSDYNAILSLPFDAVYLNNQKEKDILEFIANLVQTCPENILRKYPLCVIGFAFQLYMGGWYAAFGKLSQLIVAMIEKPEGIGEKELHRIKGEFALLTSFSAYNDIQKMSEGHKEAMKYLDSPSRFLLPTSPWTFTNISVLTMYWSKSGELENELNYMDECMPHYSKLARGHGTGADSVMRAEAMLLRGLDQEAEALCHKAVYLCGEQKQLGLGLCAGLILARIAMLRGDEEMYVISLEKIRKHTKDKPERFLLRMAELSIASLSLTLGNTKELAEWLYDLESIKKVLYAPALPQGNVLYGKLLLINKRYNELYGLSQPMLGMAAKMNYLLPQVYHLIYLAIAKHSQGQTKEAQEHLGQALAISLSDKVYMPFAEHGAALRPLLESVTVAVENKEGLKQVIKLAGRQEAGMKAIEKKLLLSKSPLTPRERDIALLAKERLSAGEIAEALFITESTVRSALKKIYCKLNIHSKAELSGIDF
ncbi:LuxR family maltose regulon positive regulatory protein [Kineothrix alysoides]|uniref:LuxR family maltose regulon positive regulatory protein n=1 Tax=Kineothrix alysoides TaxID=1469948 RepID=A0A4R1QU54_9FIRM|nr:LuxR C-terminal-related transcriptional regulator [Kineothrix alysoides]TCL57476.1 LuxR family maltose regulon positive regulatory protein [Kineothrix alysoides]